ncbi:hypothetical protein ML5_0861 [Micromonospora sp. L5]|uniref:hypothetical protein n=1 Tax=Micromonospora sp. (strain L5) TaxID=648999 RepID=UPI0001C45C8D|nr:hypothetical protein [Micromonospora sp. L5]ADU06403.1 hypothetical protein ML5_0861 [Micromonospora sp. L5]
MSNDAASEILREAGQTPKTAPAFPARRQPGSTRRPLYGNGRPGTPLSVGERAQLSRRAAEIDAALSETPEGQAILDRDPRERQWGWS